MEGLSCPPLPPLVLAHPARTSRPRPAIRPPNKAPLQLDRRELLSSRSPPRLWRPYTVAITITNLYNTFVHSPTTASSSTRFSPPITVIFWHPRARFLLRGRLATQPSHYRQLPDHLSHLPPPPWTQCRPLHRARTSRRRPPTSPSRAPPPKRKTLPRAAAAAAAAPAPGGSSRSSRRGAPSSPRSAASSASAP